MGDVVRFEPRIRVELERKRCERQGEEAQEVATCDCGGQLWLVLSSDEGLVSGFECYGCGAVFEARSGERIDGDDPEAA